MIVYRLSRGKYKNDLSGIGAELYGARWNNKGTKMLYTASSRALAMAETAVHIDFNNIPDDYHMISIEVPEDTDYLRLDDMSEYMGWDSNPPSPITQNIGDEFCEKGEFMGMFVPSVVVKGDFNLILNPLHTEFRKVRVIAAESFEFDERYIESRKK